MSFTTTKPSVGDPTKQSFASALIDNDTELRDRSIADLLRAFGDMEDWSSGTTVAPDQWTLSGAGATIARDGTNFKIGIYSAAVTRVGTDCQLALNASTWVGGTAYYRSRVFTLGAWVRATVASRARIRLNDGVATQASSYHTGGSAWEWLTVSITAAAAATQLQAELQVNTGNTTAQFDGVVLVEGTTVPPASSIRGVGSSGSIVGTMIAANTIDGTKIALGSDAQGDVMHYDGTNWVRLAAGTAEYPLVTKGAAANPVFQQLATAGIADLAVTNAKIADLAVTNAKIADDAVGLAEMAAGTAGNLITYDASGNPVAVATGTSGEVLTSNGPGVPPTMQTTAHTHALGDLSDVTATGEGSGGGFDADTVDGQHASAFAAVSTGAYTGDGTGGRAIAHGLGVVPKQVFIHNVASGGSGGVMFARINDQSSNRLESIGPDSSGGFNVTAMTSSNFYVFDNSVAGMNSNGVLFNWIAIG